MCVQLLAVWELCEKQKQCNAMIVDVRGVERYQIGHVVGALSYPADCLLETDEQEKCLTAEQCEAMEYLLQGGVWIVYCERGNVSLLVGRSLAEQGYELYSLLGGYKAYKQYMDSSIDG